MNEHNLSLEKFLSELRTITEWTVPLDENDWQSFQDNGNNHVLVLKTATDDFTEPYLLTLCHHIVEQYKKRKYPVPISSKCSFSSGIRFTPRP